MTASPRRRGRPLGRVPAHAGVPAAWRDVGGCLDLDTRVARGTIYLPRQPRRWRRLVPVAALLVAFLLLV